MGVVTIIKDGIRYTDPSKVHIPRDEKTEAFYKMVENYVPKPKKDKGTA